MGEKLLRKRFTQAQLDGTSQAQIDAAKKTERERLKILHTKQVRSSRAERLPYESYLFVRRTQLQKGGKSRNIYVLMLMCWFPLNLNETQLFALILKIHTYFKELRRTQPALNSSKCLLVASCA